MAKRKLRYSVYSSKYGNVIGTKATKKEAEKLKFYAKRKGFEKLKIIKH